MAFAQRAPNQFAFMASGCLARQIAEERDVVKVEKQIVTLSHNVDAYRIKQLDDPKEVWPEPVICAKVKDPDAEELDKLKTRKKDCLLFLFFICL